MSWKKSRDPLFRGDAAGGVAVPDPRANASIVAHILYLDGAGRATPYHSTTESEAIADHFAGRAGRVYRTLAGKAEALGVDHISRVDLLRLLRGKGSGKAKWRSALEVMTARRYVEQWEEHLLDFAGIEPTRVATVVRETYEP